MNSSLVSDIKEHMEVVGSDNGHVGIVDKIEGDRIKLTHNDSQAHGTHHYLPVSTVASVSEFVTLTMTKEQAEAYWTAGS